ncbi:mitochondrial thiamine pyrophosphate carrier-like [Pararge aegeria]|uniref:Jg13363 protein n=1 Tax=Pararge aegeria aegeria TaxID=348720 RepID=A0A8S4S3K4_9NEOP|nr:mitochondrial thiamine pyrophosphate carrier-like [Pararge aegeria]CAH2246003.1 jg13363 [Pararge aegeria aegeria]
MVQLLENIESKISGTQSAIAGGASGAVTRAIAQPLDVLKIRFQLQLEPIQRGSKYSSILQAIGSIVREEGVSALWSGHIPAQLLSVTYGIIQFSTFERLTHTCQQLEPGLYKTHKHIITFSNGAIAATVATVLSFPFDTVRTRLIAERKTCKAYRGFLNACTLIVKNEGALALYKGIAPTVAQIAPHAGIQFAVYKIFTESILNKLKFFQRSSNISEAVESSLIANVLAGGFAGFVSKTAIYPFDVIKKRLQIQGFQMYRKDFGRQIYCDGSVHCIKLTIAEEGFLALYKGYGPSILKAVFVSALHFAVYDEIKYFLLRMNK